MPEAGAVEAGEAKKAAVTGAETNCHDGSVDAISAVR
jgi:hypothetical protein